MIEYIPWVATTATILAASLVAANLGSRITGYGFIVFTIGSLLWVRIGVSTHQTALIWTNAVLTGLNLFGIWRWLGRQSKVEEGARAASVASEQIPGEALFPITLLSHAPVWDGETELGYCVDAMAGCSSGRLSYVVVSQGGLAGIGETFRRLPWNAVNVEGEKVKAAISAEKFECLDELPRDQWPAR